MDGGEADGGEGEVVKHEEFFFFFKGGEGCI